MTRENSALSIKCSSCGDDMVFDPDKGSLYCSSCQSTKTITAVKQYAKHDFVQNEKSQEKNENLANTQRVMKCPNCGAQVVLTNYHVSSVCPYCTTALVMEEKAASSITPDVVIPFKFGKEKAESLFKAKIKKSFFAPRKFKKMVSASDIQAYYFPAFTFDADSRSTYNGKLYREHRRTDSKGRSYTSRSYFHISGNQALQHKNVEVEASEKLSQEQLQWVNPYNFSQAVAYSNEYVAGFSLECNSSSAVECQKHAEVLMREEIKNSILSKYNYDGISYLDINTMLLNQKYSYCVLPMYRINYTYKNKQYSNVMNGQTGALGGKMPKSGWKITFTVLVPILFILAFILLINFL